MGKYTHKFLSEIIARIIVNGVHLNREDYAATGKTLQLSEKFRGGLLKAHVVVHYGLSP